MRTVRSAAWSRNRPRRKLAWLIVLILGVLIALAARVNAANEGLNEDSIAMAVRYANALTGADAGNCAPSDGRGTEAAGDSDEDECDEDDVFDALERGLEQTGRPRLGDGTAGISLESNDGEEGSDDEDDPGIFDAIERSVEQIGEPWTGTGNTKVNDEAEADVFDALERSLEQIGEWWTGDRTPAAGLIPGDDEMDVAERSVERGDDAVLGFADGGEVPGAGMQALFDAELDPGDPVAGIDAGAAAAEAGASETYEQWMRHQRPSAWGRLDVGVALRRRWSEPMHAPANIYNEIWLVATWRR